MTAIDYSEEMSGISEPSRPLVIWWKPEFGETIGGIVTFIGDMETSFGIQKVIHIKTSDGETNARNINAALESELVINNVQVGDEIAIKFIGKHKTVSGDKSYNSYAVKTFAKATVPSTDENFKDDVPF